MNLFVSFMLRAISVFIKDWVLYEEEDSSHCFISSVSEPCLTGAPRRPGASCRLGRGASVNTETQG